MTAKLSDLSKKVSNCSIAIEPHQFEIVRHIIEKPKCAVWCGMGGGKTFSTLVALNEILDREYASRVLIVAPPKVASHTWPTEINKWKNIAPEIVCNLDCTPIVGKPAKRARAVFRQRSAVSTISLFNLEWLINYFKELGEKWPYDVIVIDESSLFKNPQSKRFLALRKLLKTKVVSRVIELTGTSAPNGYLDLWSQIALLDDGQRLGKSYTAYKETFFKAYDYLGYDWRLRRGAKEEIDRIISDLVLSVRLPKRDEPEIIDVPVYLPQKLYTGYKKLKRESVLKVGPEPEVIESAASLSNKLAQYASGAVYHTEEKRVAHIHDLKLDAFQSLVEQANGSPILAAYNFKHEAERLEGLEGVTLFDGKDATIDCWNRREIPVLLAHPASIGHGLNLQDGGSIVFWFGPTFNLEHWQQFNKRLDRRGQTEDVRIFVISAKGTIDERILSVLQTKDVTQSDLLQAVASYGSSVNSKNLKTLAS